MADAARSRPDPTGPLAGIKVVELGVWVAGPAAGGILADWGADVVKIEPPSGDPGRQFGAMLGGDLPFNPPFELDNRGKRSIVIDLRTPAGRRVADRLLEQADVFLTNIRLAALDKLGLGPDAVCARHPALVYAAITGYGMTGPDRDRAAYDIAAFWARAGIAHVLTRPGNPPPFQRGGMGDHGAGMAAAAGISAALVARARNGRGQLVSTSLLRHGAYTIGFDINTVLRLGIPIAVGDRATMVNPMINNYQDQAGAWFWLVGLEIERHWPDLCRAVGHPEWTTDPRFRTGSDRRGNARELVSLLDGIFATRTIEQWGPVFDANDVWWAPIQDLDQVVADPQLRAAGGLVEVPDGASTTTMVATPVDFSGTPWSPRSMPPELGRDTDDVLAELGYDEAAVAELRAARVVGG
jgi:crotonobetainyl-CoA:carnitine CoA-transferase CaiB-like acyl-CoA transferase